MGNSLIFRVSLRFPLPGRRNFQDPISPNWLDCNVTQLLSFWNRIATNHCVFCTLHCSWARRTPIIWASFWQNWDKSRPLNPNWISSISPQNWTDWLDLLLRPCMRNWSNSINGLRITVMFTLQSFDSRISSPLWTRCWSWLCEWLLRTTRWVTLLIVRLLWVWGKLRFWWANSTWINRPWSTPATNMFFFGRLMKYSTNLFANAEWSLQKRASVSTS